MEPDHIGHTATAPALPPALYVAKLLTPTEDTQFQQNGQRESVLGFSTCKIQGRSAGRAAGQVPLVAGWLLWAEGAQREGGEGKELARGRMKMIYLGKRRGRQQRLPLTQGTILNWY